MESSHLVSEDGGSPTGKWFRVVSCRAVPCCGVLWHAHVCVPACFRATVLPCYRASVLPCYLHACVVAWVGGCGLAAQVNAAFLFSLSPRPGCVPFSLGDHVLPSPEMSEII